MRRVAPARLSGGGIAAGPSFFFSLLYRTPATVAMSRLHGGAAFAASGLRCETVNRSARSPMLPSYVVSSGRRRHRGRVGCAAMTNLAKDRADVGNAL